MKAARSVLRSTLGCGWARKSPGERLGDAHSKEAEAGTEAAGSRDRGRDRARAEVEAKLKAKTEAKVLIAY